MRVRDRNNDRNGGTARERTEGKGNHEGNGFEPERRHETKRENEYTEKPCASTANDGGNRETEGRDARDRESRRRTNRKRVKRGTKETRLREKVAKWEIRHIIPKETKEQRGQDGEKGGRGNLHYKRENDLR